jgi:hypothetical protein
MPHIDTPEQAAIRAKRGFICNWTGGHCPRGCRSPCTYEVDKTRVGGGIERHDYNPEQEAAQSAE